MVEKKDEYDFLYKVVIVGDSGVGKTNILSRYVSDTFHLESKPTIGVELSTKTISVKNNVIKTQFWDTAGQERYRAITGVYYKGAHGVIIAFDITKIETFRNIEKWIQEIKNHCGEDISVLIVGNKTDLKSLRAVKIEEASQFAFQNKFGYIESSAFESYNISQAFQLLIYSIFEKQNLTKNNLKSKTGENVTIGSKVDDEPKKGCC